MHTGYEAFLEQIASDFMGGQGANRIAYRIRPGAGATPPARFRIAHRAAGSTSWSHDEIAAADGGGAITAYPVGTSVELQAWAISAGGLMSAGTAILTVTIGDQDLIIPGQIDPASVTLVPMLGAISVGFETPADPAIASVQLYRASGAVLDRAAHGAGPPIEVQPSRQVSALIGDGTRRNLITGAGMGAPEAWSAGAGWEIAGGVATKTPGEVSGLAQPVDLIAGQNYRLSYSLSDVTGGVLRPRLTGGALRPGVEVSGVGRKLDRINAIAGNSGLEFQASNSFAGSLDDVVLYQETATCLAQGRHYVWLEPVNADGIPGPVSRPFEIDIE